VHDLEESADVLRILEAYGSEYASGK
jgi:hypothetical protein